jgi:putative salt-induced outer membrane protein YdiY
MKLTLTSFLALFCLASIGRGDVVTLKNGDRVTGTLVTIKGGTLRLKSDILGDLSIPMAKVATYSVDKPVVVVIQGQEPVHGTLELMPSGDWEVKANGQAQTIAAAKAEVIMPASDYQKLVVEAPEPWQAWKGSASLGYSLQNGNQQTDTLTTTINAVRERPAPPIFEPHWRTNFGFTGLFSHAREDGNTVTSRTLSANLRQDYLFTADNFAFAVGQVNHVSTQGLYLQQTYGAGLGRDLVKNARTTFSVLGGPAYVQEKFFTGLNTRTAQFLVGERLGEQFTKRLRFDHYLQVYPDLIHGGQYRFDTSTVLSFKLTNRLLVNASAIDLYLSNPPTGNEKNNITFSMGIGYSF